MPARSLCTGIQGCGGQPEDTGCKSRPSNWLWDKFSENDIANWEEFLLLYYLEAPGSGLQASLSGGCRLNAHMGNLHSRMAWAETRKDIYGRAGGWRALPGTVTCEAIRRSVGDSEAKAGRKRKREKSSVIAARRSIRSSLFSPGSPGAFDFATCILVGRCRSEDDGDQRGVGHDGPRDWSMGPVDDEIGTEGGTSTRTETQAGSDRRTGRRRQLF